MIYCNTITMLYCNALLYIHIYVYIYIYIYIYMCVCVPGSRQLKIDTGRKEDFKQLEATVYLCNNGIRLTKWFNPLALYFSPLL